MAWKRSAGYSLHRGLGLQPHHSRSLSEYQTNPLQGRSAQLGATHPSSSYAKPMALQIDDPQLVKEILAESERGKISPEEVVRRALAESRKQAKERYEAITKYLEDKVWSHIPPEQLGKRLSKQEEEALLGYGPDEY